MTLACEGSATQALDATRCGSFDFARRLASLRMTLHSVRGADQVLDWRVSRSGRIATDQKAVRRRGPGRVVLGSKPQLATAKEKLVRWAGERDCQNKLVSWAPYVQTTLYSRRGPGWCEKRVGSSASMSRVEACPSRMTSASSLPAVGPCM